MARATVSHQYYFSFNMWENEGSAKGPDRWLVSDSDPEGKSLRESLRGHPLGRPITGWRTPDVDCERASGREDVPMGVNIERPLVSDRFRKILEKEVPGEIQFLPVRMVCRGRPIKDAKYWLCNCLRVIRCADEARTQWEYHAWKQEWHAFWPVLDPLKIPVDARLFLVQDSTSLVVRHDFRALLGEAGITGLAYEEVPLNTDRPRPPKTTPRDVIKRRALKQEAAESKAEARRLARRKPAPEPVWKSLPVAPFVWISAEGEPYADSEIQDSPGWTEDPEQVAFLPLSAALQRQLRQGARVTRWPKQATAHLEEPARKVNDLLITRRPELLVSDRLRKLIERHAPGAAQFLPVRLVHEERPQGRGGFWLVNWLHTLDCLDRKLSQQQKPHGGRRSRLTVCVLRTDRIPEGVRAFRLKHSSSASLVHQELRRAIERSRLTGCNFIVVRGTRPSGSAQ